MTYKVELYALRYERHTLKEKKLVGVSFVTDYTLNRGIDDIGRIANYRAGVQATHFSASGLQSCRDRYHSDFCLPPSWQHKPGKWEPVASGTI
jgi:hypothetical protein